MARAVAAARCARRALAAQVCRGGESADYHRGSRLTIRSTHHESAHLHATVKEWWMLISSSAREGRGRWLLRGGEHVG
eukprot:scaffold22654_cov101-Phaeocystis_antarctica.AAC.1